MRGVEHHGPAEVSSDVWGLGHGARCGSREPPGWARVWGIAGGMAPLRAPRVCLCVRAGGQQCPPGGCGSSVCQSGARGAMHVAGGWRRCGRGRGCPLAHSPQCVHIWHGPWVHAEQSPGAPPQKRPDHPLALLAIGLADARETADARAASAARAVGAVRLVLHGVAVAGGRVARRFKLAINFASAHSGLDETQVQ